MRFSTRVPALLAVTAALAVTSPAFAIELVAGGYGGVGGDGAVPAAAFDRLPAPDQALPLVVEFTPRASGALLIGRARLSSTDISPSFFAPDPDSTLGQLGLSLARPDGADLLVGGAFSFDDVTVAATFGRPSLLGAEADLVTAGMAVGGVSATLGYARRFESGIAEPLDMLMLSTDLNARSWLSFESALAVAETGSDGSMAVGRVGVRLNF